MGSKELQLTRAMLQLVLFWHVVDNERLIGADTFTTSAGPGPIRIRTAGRTTLQVYRKLLVLRPQSMLLQLLAVTII
jgi:hypothetical protein